MQFLGDSRDKKLIRLIFGTPEQFQEEIRKHGNSFFIKDGRKTAVIYDKEDEIYQFYCN